MFFFDAQMAMMRAWSEAAQAGLRLMSPPPANPWTAPFAANPWGLWTSPWSTFATPWSVGAAWPQPFSAFPFWGATHPMWSMPFLKPPIPMIPMMPFGAPPALAAWMQLPMAWSSAAAEFWSPRAPAPTTWSPTAASYRSAGGHAAAAIVTPVDLARSLANFWTSAPASPRKLH